MLLNPGAACANELALVGWGFDICRKKTGRLLALCFFDNDQVLFKMFYLCCFSHLLCKKRISLYKIYRFFNVVLLFMVSQMSLYTVGKAIGFVFANALRHPLGPGRPGTDKEGVINSKT